MYRLSRDGFGTSCGTGISGVRVVTTAHRSGRQSRAVIVGHALAGHDVAERVATIKRRLGRARIFNGEGRSGSGIAVVVQTGRGRVGRGSGRGGCRAADRDDRGAASDG
jgi:hypothetical protein